MDKGNNGLATLSLLSSNLLKGSKQVASVLPDATIAHSFVPVSLID